MQKRDGRVLFSAGDLVGYLECEHLTTLGLEHLETPLQKAKADEQMALIQDMGFAHEERYLEQLRAKAVQVVEIGEDGTPESRADATLEAMRKGAELTYQAVFLSGNLLGIADFLRKVGLPSKFGAWSYEVSDTKLARSPKAEFLVQLAFYSELLAEAQGVEPVSMHLALGDGSEKTFRVANYSRYFRQVRGRFLEYVAKHPNESYPERCDHCPLCDWRERCEARWREDDHLNQVAGITRLQIGRLQAGDVKTLERLALLGEAGVPKVQREALAKLRSQAALQLEKRTTGKSRVEPIDLDPEGRRGFFRLPEKDPGDVFFDLEGDPFEPDGLDYLFGVRYLEDGQPRFQPYWAHDRAAERRAFEQFMDFIAARIRKYPGMHIYHYSHYEPTALKRMMSLHGTREAEVDDLLRQGRLVDLYKVVREAVRTSEEGLSLKDIEALYGFKREHEVATAGASVVYYHCWRDTGDDKLLAQIQSYNEDDCESTEQARDWLLGLRPDGLPWFTGGTEEKAKAASAAVQEFEARLAEYEGRLMAGIVPDREQWPADARLRELVHQLLGFYRRADKPAWWAMFARQDMTEEELIEDIECLGGLKRTDDPPVPEKKSLVYSFTFPEQDTKLRAGEDCYRTDTAQRLGEITALDEAKGTAKIKVSGGRDVPDRLSIGPQGPINSVVLREAVFRFADSLIAGDGRFSALRGLLRKDPPKISGKAAGAALLPGKGELLGEALELVQGLEESYVFIQGPPGAGKTYTGSHLIVGLLKAGKRVGVSSNSHKAIHNLLAAVERVAAEKGVAFRGAKKGNANDPDSHFDGKQIETVLKGDEAIATWLPNPTSSYAQIRRLRFRSALPLKQAAQGANLGAWTEALTGQALRHRVRIPGKGAWCETGSRGVLRGRQSRVQAHRRVERISGWYRPHTQGCRETPHRVALR